LSVTLFKKRATGLFVSLLYHQRKTQLQTDKVLKDRGAQIIAKESDPLEEIRRPPTLLK
jgi:hypothetical protein